MANFTCTQHGDQANDLVAYWTKQHKVQVRAKQWFMAAVALGCMLEAMLYAYFIIWTGDDRNDPTEDEQIPDSLVLNDLLDAAKQLDLLASVKFKDKFGNHAVQDAVHEIRHLRNSIHAGVALRKNFDPAKFRKRDYARLRKICDAVWNNMELAL